jgi:hypothetical protein
LKSPGGGRNPESSPGRGPHFQRRCISAFVSANRSGCSPRSRHCCTRFNNICRTVSVRGRHREPLAFSHLIRHVSARCSCRNKRTNCDGRCARGRSRTTARHRPVGLVSFWRRLHTPHALPQPDLSEPKHSLSGPCRCALFHSPIQRQDRRGKGLCQPCLAEVTPDHRLFCVHLF